MHNRISLGEVLISMVDLGVTKLKEFKDNSAWTLLSRVELTEMVSVYSAVMSDTKMMISAGDFIKYSDGFAEVRNFRPFA